jgi:hypothetical protein
MIEVIGLIWSGEAQEHPSALVRFPCLKSASDILIKSS